MTYYIYILYYYILKYDKPSFSSQSHPRILHYGLPGFWDNVEPDAMAMAQNAQIVAASSHPGRPGRPGRRSLRSPMPSSLDKARRKMARTSAMSETDLTVKSCG
jgi:hypothetical protein